MATKRSYQDACGAAHALDLVGERWALLVVRELLLGPKRYSDLLADLPGVSTNVLSTRLTELERGGVVEKHRLPPPAASRVYRLTDWGRELEPVVLQLGRWGARSPGHARDKHLSLSSLILSMRAMFDVESADPGSYELRIGEERFTVEVDAAGLHIDRVPHQESHAPRPVVAGTAAGGGSGAAGVAPARPTVITAEVAPFAELLYGGRPLRDAIREGTAAVEGDYSAAERLLAAFVLPPTATVPAQRQG